MVKATLRPPYHPEKDPVPGGWVGHGAAVDGYEKSLPHRSSNPGGDVCTYSPDSFFEILRIYRLWCSSIADINIVQGQLKHIHIIRWATSLF